MLQSWLSVSGIGIDLVGFLLLLREWWLAFFHESSVLELDQRRAWERTLRHHQQTTASGPLRAHLDATARIQDGMAERAAFSRHSATLTSRKRIFVFATVLIIVGALLQIAGALPPDLF